MGNKNNWDADAMKGTLISDMEQEVRDGISKVATEERGAGVESVAVPQQPKETEPTKGVQTYIAVSMYRRLSDIKLRRGDTIGNLVAEAVSLWLDVQEGKAMVSYLQNKERL